MQNQVSVIAQERTVGAQTLLGKPLQIAGALLLGLAILYGAGFVQTAEVHNAAHDMRHSQGFPCH